MCKGKIKLDINSKYDEIAQLHTKECLEYMFGKLTIMPSINKELKKQEDVMQFANKILALNPAINLPSFKESIVVNQRIVIE